MRPRIFGIDYQFLSCGNVFTQGLVHAAVQLGLDYEHADLTEADRAGIRAWKPDLVLVVHGRKFTRRSGSLLKDLRSAVWLLDEPYEVDDTATFSNRYTHVFVNDPSTLDRHHNATYLPVCYDPLVHQPSDGVRPYLVGFVGGGNPARDRYLTALARHGILSYVVGGPFGDPAVGRLALSRNIPPHATAGLYQQTQLVLNVFREKHHYNRAQLPGLSLNPRVYEATACGALVVSEWRPECDTLVPEMPTFRSPEECVTVIQNLLNDPEMAEAVRRIVADRLRSHTYAARLQTICQTIGISAMVH